MDAPRPTSDEKLAATRSALVAALNDARPSPDWAWDVLNTWDALVARVADLEAQVAEHATEHRHAEAAIADLLAEKEAAEAQVTDLEAQREWNAAFDRLDHQRRAAQAQVAALTQERDEWKGIATEWRLRREAAEVALATTRQALAEYEAIADAIILRLDKWGAPFALATEIDKLRARRALAATEKQTEPRK